VSGQPRAAAALPSVKKYEVVSLWRGRYEELLASCESVQNTVFPYVMTHLLLLARGLCQRIVYSEVNISVRNRELAN
jgi:hypothetical protein